MRAAIYVRQSEDKSGEGLAVARQLDECRNLAERNHLEIVGTYSDNDKSASTGKPRPQWQQLLKDFEADQFDVLVCWHTDRLYRRLRDLVDLVELAEQRSLRIVAVRAGDIDLTTPAGRMLAGMLGSAARYEVEQKAIRQRQANKQRAQAKISLWTRRPYGFERDGKDVRLLPAEAKEIRRAAKAVFAGKTLASIVRDMNERGLTTTVGNPWSVISLKRALMNPRVGGRITYNGQDYGQAPWKPIVAPDDYDRLRALLSDPTRRTTNDTRLRHLMSGSLICDRDGSRMYATVAASKYTAKYHVYQCKKCKRTRKLEHVDELVEGVILARIEREDVASLLGVEPDAAELQSDVDELRHRRDGLAALLADGLLTPDAVRAQAQKLNGRISAIENALSRVLGDSPVADLAQSGDVRAAWGQLSVRQRRAVVDTLAEVRVLAAGKGTRWDPETVQIEWKGQQ